MFVHRKTLFLFLILVILGGSLGLGVQNAQAATCTQYYTIQRGDTLYSIGLKYGLSWKTLAEMNGIAKPGLIYAGQKLCVSTSGTVTPTPAPTGAIPTFSISTVVKDTSVTIVTKNFPANDTYHVLMGPFGTAGIGGTKVASQASGSGGSFTATYNIPAGLKGAARIAIRLQSPTSGYFSYNWFYNNASGTGTGGVTPPTTGYTGFPSFSISAVVRNTSVTIVTYNFPPNLTFDVLMGLMGTRGANGTVVGTLNSGAGGTLTATFNIPAGLQGQERIAIRTQNLASGYFSYNWFWNFNAP